MPDNQISQPLNSEDVVLLCQELQAMLAAGVPLDVGLDGVSGSLSGPLETVAGRIAERLRAGVSLPDALAAEKDALPPTYRMVLAAGLRCGRSQEALEDVVVMTRSLAQLQQTLRRGLVYPATVVLLAAVLAGFVATQFLPRLVALYRFLRIEIPPWLLWLEQAELRAALIVLVAVIAILALFSWLFRGNQPLTGGLRWLPGFGRLLEDLRITRITSLLSLLTEYGVPLPEALALTASVTDSPRWSQQLKCLSSAVERGELLDESLARQAGFPEFLSWLIACGARESRLAVVLAQAADFYRSRAWSRAETLQRVVPLAAVILVGGSVTFLYALTVFGPMIQLWEQLSSSMNER